MKQKLKQIYYLLIWRIALFFHAEDNLMPSLKRTIAEGKLKPWHLYQSYGRVLLSIPNPKRYWCEWEVTTVETDPEDPSKLTTKTYTTDNQSLVRKAEMYGARTKEIMHNSPCNLCGLCRDNLGPEDPVIPCECDHRHYFKIIKETKQHLV